MCSYEQSLLILSAAYLVNRRIQAQSICERMLNISVCTSPFDLAATFHEATAQDSRLYSDFHAHRKAPIAELIFLVVTQLNRSSESVSMPLVPSVCFS